jgi:hypothetical protein
MSKTCSDKSKYANNPDYVCNPLSGRWIKIGGGKYNELVKKGIINEPKSPEVDEQKQSIDDLYQLYKRYAKDDNYKKMDELREIMEAHEDYWNYHPHNDELDQIPNEIVIDYFNYLIKYYGWHGDWTLNIVKQGMLNFLKGQAVLDMDLRVIIDEGWENHALKDSNPRGAIYEEIEEIMDS